MSERDEIIDELKHLVRYYEQATHEFFDETSNELKERLEAVYQCLDQNENSLEEMKRMVSFIASSQQSLKTKVNDLGYLADRMNRLF